MISVNGVKIDAERRFPDGTFSFHIFEGFSDPVGSNAEVFWHYEREDEMVALYYIVKHLREYPSIRTIRLFMPYCPNARMDRKHHEYEVFTLKYFADFINSMNFQSVFILDPHSNVATALINNCHVMSPHNLIEQAIQAIDDPDLLLFYPDEGAMKRYSDMFKVPYGFGIKRRCWETGKIIGLDIVCDENIEGRNILIIDDICCRGGTFLHSAMALKERGAKNVFVFCSHCEHTIFDGELLKTDYVDHIYTTNSIFHKEHEKITVFSV